MAAGVGERADRVAQAVVAGPAEAGALGLAGFDGDGGLAAVGGERGVGRVAVAAVAHLGEHRGGQMAVLGSRNSERKVGAVGVVCERGADLAGELGDPGDDRFQRGDEREHDLAARFGLERSARPSAAPRSRPSSSRAGRRPQ